MFKSSIPNEITTLENIRELWLSLNYFTGEIPSNIGNLQNLGERLHFFDISGFKMRSFIFTRHL